MEKKLFLAPNGNGLEYEAIGYRLKMALKKHEAHAPSISTSVIINVFK